MPVRSVNRQTSHSVRRNGSGAVRTRSPNNSTPKHDYYRRLVRGEIPNRRGGWGTPMLYLIFPAVGAAIAMGITKFISNRIASTFASMGLRRPDGLERLALRNKSSRIIFLIQKSMVILMGATWGFGIAVLYVDTLKNSSIGVGIASLSLSGVAIAASLLATFLWILRSRKAPN